MHQIYRKTPIPKCDFNKVALHKHLFLGTPLGGRFCSYLDYYIVCVLVAGKIIRNHDSVFIS